jgi:hypothetical protein
MALHAHTRDQNLVPAPTPTTRHGQEPVPVPAIRGQGSPAGMPAYPLEIHLFNKSMWEM